MRTVRPLEPSHREEWDDCVRRSAASGFMQSWDWSRFKELEGYTAFRLGLFEENALRGGVIAYYYPSQIEAGLVSMPDGPVVDWNSPHAAADVDRLIDALIAVPEAAKAAILRMEPRLERAPADLPARLSRAPMDIIPQETLMIPMGPEAEMLARMKPKGRYNAKLAAKRGVTVDFSCAPADVHDFYFILEATARFQGFAVEPKRFFINLVSALPASMVQFAFARYKGMTLATALVVRHAGTATYLYGGHLPFFSEVMANYALHWEIMRRASAEGCKNYDLYGYVSPGQPNHPYDSFSRFKEKLGGRSVRRIGARDVLLYDRLAKAAVSVFAGAAPPKA